MCAQRSWPWSTIAAVGDGSAELNEAYSREFLSLYFQIQDPTVEGVSKGVLNELEVTGVATPLAVGSGSGICYGLYINDSNTTIAVTTPAVGTTGGRVVLQTNWAGTGGAPLEARTRIAVIMSADGNPAIPGLTQAFGTTWEISLATFTITTGGAITKTDDRTFRRSTAMVDTDEITNLAVTVDKIGNLAVNTAKIANNVVDDTKVGSRVPRFYRRQGGNATNWNVVGNNTYTPTIVRMQAGTKAWTGSATSGTVTVTCPVVFGAQFIVFVQPCGNDATWKAISCSVQYSASLDVFIIDWIDNAGITQTGINFYWLAIGPE